MQDRFKFRTYIPDRKFFKFWGWIKKGEYKGLCSTGEYSLDELLEKYTNQCTGLKDKNGKLIYENDIVKRNGDLLIVRYQEEMSCLTPQYFYLENDEIAYSSREWFEEYNNEDCELYTSNYYEVIGNIYENKGLLVKYTTNETQKTTS